MTAPRETTRVAQHPSVGAVALSRLSDFVELAKPRIAVMALVTVTVGFILASTSVGWQTSALFSGLFGIALVAVSSSVFNQVIERDSDRLMPRTENRPLPSGRMSSTEALLFGFATGLIGIVWLIFMVNLTTAILGGVTLLLYVAIYTPLKRKTSLCTAIGAVPGALPPVLGWTAAGGELNAQAFSLFAILFIWQFPHFLAIAWIYQKQYRGAGLIMLPANGRMPRVVGVMAVAYALVLLPVSLLPAELSLAGTGYLLTATVLGVFYAVFAARFAVSENDKEARRLLYASLVYLPVLLLSLTWDHLQLLN